MPILPLSTLTNHHTPVKPIKREDNDIFGSKSPKREENEIFATSYNDQFIKTKNEIEGLPAGYIRSQKGDHRRDLTPSRERKFLDGNIMKNLLVGCNTERTMQEINLNVVSI